MIKGIFAFLMMWGLVAGGIMTFRSLTRSEKIFTLKTWFWSGVFAAVAAVLLVSIVVLF